MTGGVSTFAYELSRHMGLAGHDVMALAPDCGITEVDQAHAEAVGVDLRSVPFYKKDTPKPLWYLMFPIYLLSYLFTALLKTRLHGRGPILAAYWFPDGYIAKLTARMLGTKFYVTAHGLDILRNADNPSKSRRLIKTLSAADKVFCVSSYTADRLRGAGLQREQIVNIPNGVDLNTFQPDEGLGHEVRQKYGLEGKFVILTVGRLVLRKGHATVISAMPKILERHPDAVYLVAGDGPEAENIEALADELGVRDKLLMLGAIAASELVGLYNACDIFAMPNFIGPNPWDVEGFGIVFLEAAACGKPVIAGDSGGAVDAIEDEKSGFLVAERDVDQLASAVNKLLGDAGLRAQMGSYGLDRARTHFNWMYIAKRYSQEMGL